MGSNQNLLWHTNPFLSQENETFFIFFKNHTPSQSKITSVFAPFGSLTGVVSDSEFFSEQQLVSFMSSELLYEVIALQKSNLEYPK